MKLSILVPVYHEEHRVGAALEQALAVKYQCDTCRGPSWYRPGSRRRQPRSRWVDDHRVRVVRHPRNLGKGAAVRTAAEHATGDFMVILDADLEYDSRHIPAMLEPVLDGRAEVVYGNRTFGGHSSYLYRYVVGNKVITTAANILFNCYLSDLETGLKLMPVSLYRSLDVRSRGFGVEAEVTGKLLRRDVRPYEAPIRYRARSRAEGKKITWRDGVAALWILARERTRRRAPVPVR